MSSIAVSAAVSLMASQIINVSLYTSISLSCILVHTVLGRSFYKYS